MNNEISELIQLIDSESLYRHVEALEGVKHPLDSPQALAKAAAYLSAAMHQSGCRVRLQPFMVDGFEDVFYNVEGWLGDENQPAIVLVAHYDNVPNDPGANDNAAGLAAILEMARILSRLPEGAPHIRFLAVSLEEGNPALEKARRESLQRLRLVDENLPDSLQASRDLLERLPDFTLAALWSGETYGHGYARFAEHYDEQLSEELKAHLQDLNVLYGRYDVLSSIGMVNRIGSSIWLRESLRIGRLLRYTICLDEIGSISPQPGSQRFPSNMPFDRIKTYQVDLDQRVGDFVMAITDERSRMLGQRFFESCQNAGVDLPCLWLPLPASGAMAARDYPQALGSDHAPFWVADIPALSLTDTAYLRNPYTHTPQDTIDKVDFSQVKKICKAVLGMILG